MTFQDQTIMHGDVQVGDCWRACIASVIGKRTEGVPHFALLGDLHWLDATFAWLSYKGFDWELMLEDHNDGELLPLHIIRGMGPRGIRHAVVGDTATGAMVHDPHPSREGLATVDGRIYIYKKREVQ